MNHETPRGNFRQQQAPLQRGQGLEHMQPQQKLTSQLKQHALILKLEHARIVHRENLPELEFMRRLDSEAILSDIGSPSKWFEGVHTWYANTRSTARS